MGRAGSLGLDGFKSLGNSEHVFVANCQFKPSPPLLRLCSMDGCGQPS